MGKLPNLQAIEVDFYWQLKTTVDKLPLRWYPKFDATIFEQTWGSTSLGFGGVGGQAITSAYTTVIWEESMSFYGVYFDGSLAYIIENPNDSFNFDLWTRRQMAPVSRKGKYLKKDDI